MKAQGAWGRPRARVQWSRPVRTKKGPQKESLLHLETVSLRIEILNVQWLGPDISKAGNPPKGHRENARSTPKREPTMEP